MIAQDKNMTDSATRPESASMHIREIVGGFQVDVELGGTVKFNTQLSNSRHRHNFFEICYVVAGHGEYVHGAERYKLSPGDVFAAEPNVSHEISSYGSQNLEVYFIRLSGIALETLPSSGSEDVLALFLARRKVYAKTDGLLMHFVALLRSRAFQSEKLLRLFANEIAKTLLWERPKRVDPSAGNEFDVIFAFMDANLGRRFRCKELAEVFGTSERTLRRKFHQATGTTLTEEILHRRIRASAHWLLEGRSVQEISDRLLNMDPSQFSRCFRRIVGKSPKAFQQSYVPGSIHHSTRP
jgi:AraC-like DNA-binding protein/quercetin dioxygenase-like cupin family protein